MELSDKEVIRIAETLDMIPPGVGSILEVGCGDGRVIKSIYQKYNLTGIDINKGKIKTFPGNKIIGDISRLPIKKEKFHLVLSTEVLEHLDDQAYLFALREISRVVKKYILITVPFKETLSAQWNKCSKCGHIFHSWGHIRRFNLKILKKLFKDAFLIEMRVLSPKETWIPSILHVIARKLGHAWGTYQGNPPLCPKCGSEPLKNHGNLFGWIFIRLIWRMDRISLFRKPIWIGCLYKKLY